MNSTVGKVIATVVGVPCMAILAYWCYSIFFGLIASLIMWNASLIFCNLKFWIIPDSISILRSLSWAMSVIVCSFLLIGI